MLHALRTFNLKARVKQTYLKQDSRYSNYENTFLGKEDFLLTTKNGFLTLVIIDILFLGTYFIYLLSPVYLGYFPIGIAQIFLLVLCSSILLLFCARNGIFVNLRKINRIDIVLFCGYIVSIIGMFYSVFIWYAFKP